MDITQLDAQVDANTRLNVALLDVISLTCATLKNIDAEATFELVEQLERLLIEPRLGRHDERRTVCEYLKRNLTSQTGPRSEEDC